ncbi:MAG: DUF3240 family protein [Gammaproteobacteria bacterium]
MNAAVLARLTLIYPPALEATIIELLLEHEPELPGFTTIDCEGHGADFDVASVRERVRGRVARGMLVMVLPQVGVDGVITALAAHIRNPEVHWWVVPVSAYGQLA